MRLPRHMLLRAMFTAVGAASLLATAYPHAAMAASGKRGLGLEPASVIRQIRPGATITVPLQLTNDTGATLRIMTSVVAGAGSRDGNSLVRVDPAASTDASRNPASWVAFPDAKITLAAHASRNVTLRVTAPKDAHAGVHVALATFSVRTTATGHGAMGVSGTAGLASALLLEVPGHARASARIVSTSGPHSVRAGHGGTWAVRVANDGDTLLHADAELRLKAPWSAKRTIDADEQLILPGGERRFRFAYDDAPLAGHYTPQLVVVGGAGSDVRLTRSLHGVWIQPPWWLVAAVIAAIVLAGVGTRARRRRSVSR